MPRRNSLISTARGSDTLKEPREAPHDDGLDGAAEILDVDGLDWVASAAEEGDHPRAPHHVAHATEEAAIDLADHEPRGRSTASPAAENSFSSASLLRP